MTEPSLLLLIPAYNEERRIEPVLRDYARYFQEHYHGKFQLVVVLNGCTRQHPRRGAARGRGISRRSWRWNFPEPIGKGGALIEGLKLAPLADLIGYVDADGATPPRAFHELVSTSAKRTASSARAGCRARCCTWSKAASASSPAGCSISSSRLLFRMNIRDTQCGAKVMRREAVEKVHSTLRIADMAFDINLLYSLKRAGYRILEVPTEWTDKIGSKVRWAGRRW